MQVVCSGISTPTPSPRVQRRQYEGYSRPFLRGYLQTQGSTTPPFHHKPGSREHKHPDANDSSLRDSIPAMTKPVAVTCLVLNIFIPGLGEKTYFFACMFGYIISILQIFNFYSSRKICMLHGRNS